MTIDCSAGGGPENGALIIDAPGKQVRIRNIGLSLTSAASIYPIEIIAAADVLLENVTISGGVRGIYDRRTGPGKLVIRNSSVTTSNGPAIVIAPQSGSVIATVLEDVTAANSNYGLAVGRGARVLVNRSTFSGNKTAGVHSDTGGIIEIEDSLIAMNPTGINASTGSTVSVSRSRINSNNIGISGATTTYGNNKFFANAASDGTTPTPANLR